MMNQVAEESVRFISLGSRRQKQIAKGLLSEGLLAKDVYLVQKGDCLLYTSRRRNGCAAFMTFMNRFRKKGTACPLRIWP